MPRHIAMASRRYQPIQSLFAPRLLNSFSHLGEVIESLSRTQTIRNSALCVKDEASALMFSPHRS